MPQWPRCSVPRDPGPGCAGGSAGSSRPPGRWKGRAHRAGSAYLEARLENGFGKQCTPEIKNAPVTIDWNVSKINSAERGSGQEVHSAGALDFLGDLAVHPGRETG